MAVCLQYILIIYFHGPGYADFIVYTGGFLITARGHSPSLADITIAHTVVGAVAS